MSPILPVFGQNCEVNFPGTSNLTFSGACGGPTVANLDLGGNINLSDGDTFTFNIPVVNITGNLHIDVDGNGKIIIPAGVTVNVGGDVQLHNKNSECTSANPCIFEIVVNGTANFTDDLDNDLVTLVWSGTGTVIVDDKFKNTNNGCMNCGVGGCPNIQVDPSDCRDDGSGCAGGDFCTKINSCSSDITIPVISGCPSHQMVIMTGSGCSQSVIWTLPTASDNCALASFIPSHSSGTAFPEGLTVVTYTATDAAGNVSTCEFNVTVKNETLPVISNCPNDINLKGNEMQMASAEWMVPTASALCNDVTLAGSHQPGDLFPVGTTKVQYVAEDGGGNKAYCYFNVIVSKMEMGIDIDININININKLVTPDGNGINDQWILTNIEKFPNNKVVVVDRWGGLIFTGARYNNENVVWRGTNRSGEPVPTGTYFYSVFVTFGSATIEKTGSIELIR